MKRARIFATVSAITSILLLCAMCATVAYNYAAAQNIPQWGSAPAWVAFFYAIPYGIGILICTVLWWAFFKKSKRD